MSMKKTDTKKEKTETNAERLKRFWRELTNEFDAFTILL